MTVFAGTLESQGYDEPAFPIFQLPPVCIVHPPLAPTFLPHGLLKFRGVFTPLLKSQYIKGKSVAECGPRPAARGTVGRT